MVPPMTFDPGSLRYRHRFASDQSLIDGYASFDDFTVDGDLFTGPDTKAVTHDDFVEADLFIGAVVFEPPRRFWREVEQRPDRPGGLLSGSQFQYLPKQHQNRDHGCGLEIDRHRAIGFAEGRREDARE